MTKSHLIEDWRPDDEAFWRRSGRRVARRNLSFSVFAEFLGFSIWQLWSVVAVKLGAAGFHFSTSRLFWLISIPGLIGATLRFPYTFGPARFGGRNWTVFSALVLLLPAIGLAMAVGHPGTPYWVFVLLAGTAGLGGGNFSSSMANISYFYPDRSKGTALGINAAGGNLGVAVVQRLVPWVVAGGLGGAILGGFTGHPGLYHHGLYHHGFYLQNAGLIYVPLILIAAIGAWRYMDNLAGLRSSFADQAVVVKRRYTWTVMWLYCGAFGSFIGYSAALPLLIKTQFKAVDPLAYAFLGPLVGSVARPFGAWLSDRVGGARVTTGTFVGMSAAVPVLLVFLHGRAFTGFLAMFLVLFVLSGMANGSVFRMVPALARKWVFDHLGNNPETQAMARRETAAVIGLSAAVAAYGGFLIPQGFNASISSTGTPDPAFYVFVGFYVSCVAVTYLQFIARSVVARSRWSMAEANA